MELFDIFTVKNNLDPLHLYTYILAIVELVQKGLILLIVWKVIKVHIW